MKDIHKERKEQQDKFTALTTESIRGIREIKNPRCKKYLGFSIVLYEKCF
jgi:hypothetical protein